MCNKSRLELYFGNLSSPGLYRTIFQPPGISSPIVGIRGTTIQPIGQPFIWTPSSHSLALLFVTAVKRILTSDSNGLPLLEGPSGSPAGTLARLIRKRTTSWLHDIFGSDASGRSLLHRIIVLGNQRGLLHGPITATLRTEYLPPTCIRVFVDGEDISNNLKAISSLLKSLSSSFVPRKDPLAKRRKKHPFQSFIPRTREPYQEMATGKL